MSNRKVVTVGTTAPPQVKITLAELSGSLALKLMGAFLDTLPSPLGGETIAVVANVGGTVSVAAGIVDVGLEGAAVEPPPLPPPQADSNTELRSAMLNDILLWHINFI